MARTNAEEREGAPSLVLMHFAFVLTGLATAMLGPILPVLLRQWHLSDQQGGLLLMSQFCGSFLGGATMTRRLRRDLLLGLGAAAVGMAGFGVARGLWLACPALLLGGWGVGHSITAVNLLAGRRFVERRASRLALLNFFWSFGAMLAPMLAGLLLGRFALRSLLLGFAALFLGSGLGLAPGRRRGEALSAANGEAAGGGLTRRVFLYFAAMLWVYGGLETCMSGWLTTYALRYGERTLLLSESATLLLWTSLTAGRALSAAVLRRVPELVVWRVALLLVALLIPALAAVHTAAGIGGLTVLLGLSLSPWFPIVFARVVGAGATARQGGFILAVSGLGAACLPYLMGLVSTATGSLRRALLVPLFAGSVLFLMSLRETRGGDAGLAQAKERRIKSA